LAQSRSGLLRFLRARNFDVLKARDQAVTCCRWRAAVRPWAVDPAFIPTALPSGVWRFGGHTKAGMPILQVDVAEWRPWEYRWGIDEYIRYVAYMMEGACGRMGPGVEQVCMIWSMKGWTAQMMQPLPVRCAAQLLYIWQTMYPERIGAIFLCNVAAMFQGYFFNILRPWMSHRFLSAIYFVGNTPLQRLLEHIDLSQLPRYVGLTEIGGSHQDYPVPYRSVPDELDAFVADLGGPDNLPAASEVHKTIAVPQQSSFDGSASGTHTGEVDLLQGRTFSLEISLVHETVSVDWYISGELHGVVFGYKICRPGMLGDSTLEEGTSTSAPASGAESPIAAPAITGNLAIQEAWAGCTLKLVLYSTYSREDCKVLGYCIGIEAQ